MDLSVGYRLKKAFNVFMNRDPTDGYDDGPSSYYRPDRPRLTRGNERSMVTSVFNRIALDVAAMEIIPCKVDEDGNFKEPNKNGLYDCLTLSANIDQTGRAFKQDAVLSMLDEGVIALVPIETSKNPNDTEGYEIYSMRVGKIIQWKPTKVLVNVYDERKGIRRDIWVAKQSIAIVESPLFSVINEPNSTLQRLMRKLSLLDMTDDKNTSGKMDLIIQLPYTIRTDAKIREAEKRRRQVENQLVNSKYGIAYIDGTERITQLNRPLENNLMAQVEYLYDMFWSELGITKEVMNGTADEKTMLNYYDRSVEPIVASLVDAMRRTFISKTAMTRGNDIVAFRDPFKLVPIGDLAEMADKFTRNKIMTSNEIRTKAIGLRPSSDPGADRLENSNIKQTTGSIPGVGGSNQGIDSGGETIGDDEKGESQNA